MHAVEVKMSLYICSLESQKIQIHKLYCNIFKEEEKTSILSRQNFIQTLRFFKTFLFSLPSKTSPGMKGIACSASLQMSTSLPVYQWYQFTSLPISNSLPVYQCLPVYVYQFTSLQSTSLPMVASDPVVILIG